jgi:NADH-quinone oxidoreductase subunit N
MAVAAAVNAAVAAYYYLRVIGVMYLRTPLRPLAGSGAVPTLVASVVLAVGTLLLGVYPQPVVKAARQAAPVPEAPATAAQTR